VLENFGTENQKKNAGVCTGGTVANTISTTRLFFLTELKLFVFIFIFCASLSWSNESRKPRYKLNSFVVVVFATRKDNYDYVNTVLDYVFYAI